ncbi:MAG TPA: helix-hairpin-helix domain-containing protein [Thermoanaerobaculia bacterium]
MRDTTRRRANGSVPETSLPLPPTSAAALIDVDRASATELEVLPGIGPALARRIVATRDSSGPFGSLDALQSRVRGVGPALSKRLAQAVTFSGPHSPPSAERTEPFGNGATPAPSEGRRRH